MTRYIIQRILIAVPTLFLISAIAFWLGQYSITDPLSTRGAVTYTAPSMDPDLESEHYRRQAHQFHVDRPIFYFSILPNCYPDSLYVLFPYHRRVRMQRLALACGSWQPVAAYEHQLSTVVRHFESTYNTIEPSSSLNSALSDLLKSSDYETASRCMDSLKGIVQDRALQGHIDTLRHYLEALAPRSVWSMPVVYWHGADNQYHNWLTGRYAAEQGSSWNRIRYSLRVSLFVNGLAILVALLVGIPVGVWLTNTSIRWVDRLSRFLLVISTILPVLVIACMLRYLFATPGHGWFLEAIGGIGTSLYDPSRQSFMGWVGVNWGRLLLPTLTLVMHYAALIALQMRSSMLVVKREDYLRTAKAKGVPNWRIQWFHAVPNALFPIITIMGSLLPGAVSGSIITESIFNINGLGHASVEAVLTGDYPVMMSIVLMTSVLTITGNLLVDLLYAWLDPRVRLGFST